MLMQRMAVSFLLAAAAGTCAAQAYPAKPLRVLVASVAGGPPDLIMRGLSEPLRADFGQPIVVENMPAGDGIVAAQTMLRGPADGYTILMASGGPITVNPAFNTAKLPYDPERDFQPLVMIAQFNSVFLAHASLGVNSLKELIALAKS